MMARRGWLGWVVAAIGLITLASGGVQMVAPQLILGLVGGETTAGAMHFFAIVGMFMLLFGGATVQAVRSGNGELLAASMLQKFGASGAVGLGVARGIFSPLALVVAGFDLISAVLTLVYWRSVRGAK